ncbi:MAG: LemA family protein [Deltaproteobacteria bacterium]
MKEIIEKLYAEELKLITAKPVLVRPKREVAKKIREKVWDQQTGAIKVAIVSFTLLLFTGCVYYYNLYTTELYMVRLEAAQIEAELQRRGDLIPGLVKAVTDYMAYEGKVFVHAADVRSALGSLKDFPKEGATLPIDPQSIANFKTAISKFQAVAENYPDLKSSVTYQNLMTELANTETRLAMARSRYNTSANLYNTSLELVPGVFFRHLLGFHHAQTFIADKATSLPAAKK